MVASGDEGAARAATIGCVLDGSEPREGLRVLFELFTAMGIRDTPMQALGHWLRLHGDDGGGLLRAEYAALTQRLLAAPLPSSEVAYHMLSDARIFAPETARWLGRAAVVPLLATVLHALERSVGTDATADPRKQLEHAEWGLTVQDIVGILVDEDVRLGPAAATALRAAMQRMGMDGAEDDDHWLWEAARPQWGGLGVSRVTEPAVFSDAGRRPAVLRIRGPRVRFEWSGEAVEVDGDDLWAALLALRREHLEPRNLLLGLTAARRDVGPSGMSRSMSGGRKAYRHVMGRPCGQEDLVDVLEPEDDVTALATCDEQAAFRRRWAASLGSSRG